MQPQENYIQISKILSLSICLNTYHNSSGLITWATYLTTCAGIYLYLGTAGEGS